MKQTKVYVRQLFFGHSKKLFELLCLFILSFILVACQGVKNLEPLADLQATQKQAKEIKLLATAFPAYDLAYSLLFTQVVNGEDLQVNLPAPLPFAVKLELLTPAGTDPHTFEPSIRTAYNLEQADMILRVGLDIDQQYETLIANLRESTQHQQKLFNMCQQFDLLSNATVAPDDNNSNLLTKDPHIWLSPKRQIKLLEALSRALIDLVKQKYPADLPLFKTFITRQKKELINLWQNLDRAYETAFKTATLKEIIFADRFPLRYLCYDYGLSGKAAFNGCSHQLDPNLQTLTALHNLVQKEDCHIVFYTEFGQAKLAKVISGDDKEITVTAAKKLLAQAKSKTKSATSNKQTRRFVALLRTGHTISQTELAEGYTIYAMQRDNLALLDLATHQSYAMNFEDN